jgi:uncharacterized membrane protein YqhA
MLKFFFRIRYMTALAVLASLLGAALLLVIGTSHVLEAISLYLGFAAAHVSGNESTEAVVAVIESLDNFLLAFVLIYFAYSVYFLFIRDTPTAEQQAAVGMPAWLQVENLGHMKRVLLEVILVLIAVLFLKLVFTEQGELDWSILILPVMTVSIAVSLKLVHFD